MKEDIWTNTQPGDLDQPARSPLHDAKVMMVDDEPLMTDLIQAYLEDEGYVNFVVTNNPREALALLRSEEPSVLLLDLMMPQLSGFDLLEMIRGDRKLRYTPVIVLTAATGADAKLRALQLGVTDFLSKPVDQSELVLRLRNTLAFHQYHKRMVNFDAVTDLPNQRLFERGVDEIISRKDLVGGMVALFSISIPDCRQVRETMDQASADTLDKVLARRLTRFANEADTRANAMTTSIERAPRVARLGAEQFGLVLEGMATADAIEAAAKRVINAISEIVTLGAHEIGPSAWVGIAVSPADGDSAEALRKGAHLASTHARQQAGAQFKFASAELNAKSYERLALGSQLRHAAERGELRLHYQPKIDIRRNRIIGAEALVRWQHPELGLLAPVRFITMAEELGLINSIGQWVVKRACLDAAAWARVGFEGLTIAINAAKPQFLTGELCDVTRQALSDSGLMPHQIIIELTESMLMDNVQGCLALMRQLKRLGVKLSIDDFGTGYSSLSYLKSFPLDELKVDRSFLIDLPGTAADRAIVQAVISLGHSLDMSVTGEGVETAAQLAAIKAMGCDNYQGFLYSRPVPLEQFVGLLQQERARQAPIP